MFYHIQKHTYNVIFKNTHAHECVIEIDHLHVFNTIYNRVVPTKTIVFFNCFNKKS